MLISNILLDQKNSKREGKKQRRGLFSVYLEHGDVRMHLVALGLVFAAAGPYGISLEGQEEEASGHGAFGLDLHLVRGVGRLNQMPP